MKRNFITKVQLTQNPLLINGGKLVFIFTEIEILPKSDPFVPIVSPNFFKEKGFINAKEGLLTAGC